MKLEPNFWLKEIAFNQFYSVSTVCLFEQEVQNKVEYLDMIYSLFFPAEIFGMTDFEVLNFYLNHAWEIVSELTPF